MSVPGNLYTPTIRKTRGADYLIEQSLRFNDDDTAYLTRTPGSAGNRKTWTYSCWLKPSTSGTYESFLYAGVTGNRIRIFINSDLKIYILNDTASVRTVTLYTDTLFGDPSAWYHIVIACDTTQATDTDKIRLWVNGVQVDLLGAGANYPSLNEDLHINNSVVHNIGYDDSYYLDGLMALPILVDGTALDPTSFGEEDAEGYWNPIEYTGSFGTNGFVLDFSDTSNFGDDTSGNGNDYTPNNFTAADQLSDTPTDSADDEIGNFATFSPIYTRGATNYLSRMAFSEGNTKVTFSNNAGAVIPFNLAGFASQIEFTFSGSSGDDKVGFIDDATYSGELASIIVNPETGKWYFENGGNKSVNGASETSYGSSWTTNRITVYITASGYVYYAIDGTLQNSASIANIEADAGTNAAFQITSDTFFAFAGGRNTSTIITVNTGQTAFTDTTPSGHGDVATQNLPEASITTPFTDGFTGNASAEGPVVYTGAAPDVSGTCTINGNAVTWGTHAIPLANGFKLITSSTSYNASGANTCSIDLLTESEGGAFQGGSNVSTQGRARYA